MSATTTRTRPASTCRYCNQNTGFLRKQHGQCRDLHASGYQEMVHLAAQAASTHTFDDATLSGLALSGVNIGTFDSATTDYTASVGNEVAETTVTATANDGGATYVVKLGGAEDADGTVTLAVGDNTVSVVVTAEDGQTTRTYTVTVTRTEAETDIQSATLDTLTGEVIGKGQARLDWNDVAGATGYGVQFYTPTPDGWVDLPTDDIGIVYDGSSATVSGLPDDEFYYFRVRADWSEWPPGFLTLENPDT